MEKTKGLDYEQRERFSWCARVIRNLNLGETIIDATGDRLTFDILKGSMRTHRFSDLENLVSFAEECFSRKKERKPLTARSPKQPYMRHSVLSYV